MKKVIVILNESHSLMPDQAARIKSDFAGFTPEILRVPVSGWTLQEIKDVIEFDIGDKPVVFASPVPAMILLLAGQRAGCDTYVFHNDERVAKEIKKIDGTVRVIHVVSPVGWQII